MIVTEKILAEIFAQLPTVTDSNNEVFSVKFSWGGEKDLNPYLKSLAGAKYPLIWLVEGDDLIEHGAHAATRKAKLFIAKKSENRDALNPTVYNGDFAETLNPILENMVKAIEKSGATKIVGTKYRVSRRANYTEVDNKNTESPAIDCWNVILWEGEIEFLEKADGTPLCINQIRF